MENGKASLDYAPIPELYSIPENLFSDPLPSLEADFVARLLPAPHAYEMDGILK